MCIRDSNETLTISIARHHNGTLTISIARHDAARNSLLRPSKCNEARNSRFVNSADRELKHSQGVVEVGEQCDFQPFLLSFYLLLLLLFREKSQPRFIFTRRRQKRTCTTRPTWNAGPHPYSPPADEVDIGGTLDPVNLFH